MVRIGGAMIQEVRYADDVALVTTTRQELERTSRSSESMCEEEEEERNGSE